MRPRAFSCPGCNGASGQPGDLRSTSSNHFFDASGDHSGIRDCPKRSAACGELLARIAAWQIPVSGTVRPPNLILLHLRSQANLRGRMHFASEQCCCGAQPRAAAAAHVVQQFGRRSERPLQVGDLPTKFSLSKEGIHHEGSSQVLSERSWFRSRFVFGNPYGFRTATR